MTHHRGKPKGSRHPKLTSTNLSLRVPKHAGGQVGERVRRTRLNTAHGDGPPTWVQGRGRPWERFASSAAEARADHKQALRRLQRHASTRPEAQALLGQIKGCRPGHRCCCGACPKCLRALQRWWVTQTALLIGPGLKSSDIYMMTMVPPFGRVPLADIIDFNLDAFLRKARRLLKSAGIAVAFGGTDFSVNTKPGDQEPWLQIQLTMFTPIVTQKARNYLQAALQGSESVKRPLMIKPFDGNNAGLAYAMKPNFTLRESYLATNDHRSDRKPSWNTRNRPLRGLNWLSLMNFLSRTGLHNRLLLIGIKRVNFNHNIKLKYLK